jgi:DnaK suppressor protein
LNNLTKAAGNVTIIAIQRRMRGLKARHLFVGSIKDKMNRKEIGKYKTELEAKREELSAGLKRREDIAVENAADTLDAVQLAAERELAIRNLDRETSLLRDVKGALVRIASDTYGVCVHCEEEIKSKRLDAVPWTKYCIRCQEAVDRREPEEDETGDSQEAAA